MPGKEFAMRLVPGLEVDIENFALVTHAVPPEPLREVVPDRFELDTISVDGQEKALISSSSFCNRDLHVTGIPRPRHTFNQSTYRTYVTYRGRKCSYFLGTYVGTRLSLAAQKSVALTTYLADFDVAITSDGAGYQSYSSIARCAAGDLVFAVDATNEPGPVTGFSGAEQHVLFITHRLWGITQSPLGFAVVGWVSHRQMTPWQGRLRSGRFEFPTRLGVLDEGQWNHPLSVLVEPSVRFTLYPPVPAL